MTRAEMNHLRMLLGWVRCEIGQSPEEFEQTLRHVAGLIPGPVTDAAKQRLVEHHDKARSVPKYVRSAVKALEKVAGRQGEAVDALPSIRKLSAEG